MEGTTIREKKFWLVYAVSNGDGHDTLQSAIAEAEKFAKKHPGQKFYVMESVVGKVAHLTANIVFSEGDDTQTEDSYSISSWWEKDHSCFFATSSYVPGIFFGGESRAHAEAKAWDCIIDVKLGRRKKPEPMYFRKDPEEPKATTDSGEHVVTYVVQCRKGQLKVFGR